MTSTAQTNTIRPHISICMITYNHETFISQALESILKQKGTFSYEIVIGEDCSTDSTRNILEAYKKQYPQIIKLLLHDTNIGMMENFIQTFQACSGKYIAILEGDDYWVDPEKLQKQINFLDNNPEYVITYTSAFTFSGNDVIHGKSGGIEKDFSAEELMQTPPINTLTTCFRNVIQKFPSEMYASKFGDLFLWSLLGAYGKGKFIEDIEPSMYRMHEGGVFSEKTKKQKYEMALITDSLLFSYYSRIKNDELSKYFKYRLLNQWIISESTNTLLVYLVSLKLQNIKRKIINKFNKIKYWNYND